MQTLMLYNVCLFVCLFVSVQCQNLLPISPISPISAHHPITATLPALHCPSPCLLPLLLAMASVPPPVANSQLRLPLNSRAICPQPVLATRPERCPRVSVSRSTSSYWRGASRCLQEPSVYSPPPPALPPPHLTFLLQLPTALARSLLHQLWGKTSQVCVKTLTTNTFPSHGGQRMHI